MELEEIVELKDLVTFLFCLSQNPGFYSVSGRSEKKLARTISNWRDPSFFPRRPSSCQKTTDSYCRKDLFDVSALGLKQVAIVGIKCNDK